jgi:uncharacterized membrane protein YdbT with pleckstrin-like domain
MPEAVSESLRERFRGRLSYASPVARLVPGEQVMFEGHPSWRSILDFYAKGLALTLVAALIAAGVTRIVDGHVNAGVVVVVAVVGVALTIFAGFVKRITTHYTITNRRLRIQRGLISREIQETRLERVQNVNYNQSVLQRILQIGDVDFDTAGSDDYNFVFAGVAEPEGVVRSVDAATSSAAAGVHGLGEATAPTRIQ